MRKLQNKFKRPKMLWDSALIAEDKEILKEYGLRRKKEIWAVKALVSNFRRRARELNAVKNKDKEKELVEKINKLGFIKATTLDDILSLSLKNVLDRRLQTIIHKKGFTKTARQARQLIVHGHVTVEGRKTNFPSYLVPLSEEGKVGVTMDIDKLKPPLVQKPAKVEQPAENK